MNAEINMQAARRNLIRWRILGAIYQDRLVEASDELIQIVMQSRMTATQAEVRSELTYLEQRRLVRVKRHSEHWQASLTWIGIDLVEFTISCEPGIARPPAEATPNRKQLMTRMLRGRIMHVLCIGGSEPMQESLMLECIAGPDFQCSPSQLRLELHYMSLRGLITVPDDRSLQDWTCQMTREGTDVAQGTVECYPGITLRPACNASV